MGESDSIPVDSAILSCHFNPSLYHIRHSAIKPLGECFKHRIIAYTFMTETKGLFEPLPVRSVHVA